MKTETYKGFRIYFVKYHTHMESTIIPFGLIDKGIIKKEMIEKAKKRIDKIYDVLLKNKEEL